MIEGADAETIRRFYRDWYRPDLMAVAAVGDFDPDEIERWLDEGVSGMENSFRARPRDIREQYERKLEQAHAALGEKELELKARKRWQRLLDEDENS